MSDETLFHIALEKPTAERAAFLEQACAGDEARRRRIEELLRSHEMPDSFLVNSELNPELTSDSDPSEMPSDGRPDRPDAKSNGRTPHTDGPGSFIGPYKLLQPIGEGGMGTVYMAEQRAPVHRMVALKVIKAGMDSRQVLARFGAERQALALMDHPNIARVFDAGTTEQGLPYFVMELVKGIPITRYCDERRLTTRERLELAIPVCQAVQHAHQKGVIHRDIKPSNVLIALYDGKPVPKIIDFGVAKATGPRLTDQTLYTEFGAVVGTLEYMSPEQAELNQLDIDTRSDIYSLGVLIYELLTGSTPLDRRRLKQGAILEMLRVIREEESPRPSMRVSTIEELPSIAACRNIEPRKLSGLMQGELDWIVMKALEKDRNRRYETANGLAADLRRYLDDEPVQACPPTVAYLLSKFAKKNRVALSTASAFIAVLIAATAISFWQAVRAYQARAEAVLAYGGENQQRREAQDQRDRALRAEGDAKANLARARSAVNDYLTTISESRLLKSPIPGLQPLRKELLTTALKYYEDFVSQNRDEPVLQADLAAATLRVGEITDQIGSKQEALKAFQSALSIYESLARADRSPTRRTYLAGQGRCFVRMAMIQDSQGGTDKTRGMFERAIALLKQLHLEQPRDEVIRAELAFAYDNLSVKLMRHANSEAAVRHQRAAIELREGLVKEFPKKLSHRIDLALSLSHLGEVLYRDGLMAQAFDSWRRANALQRALIEEHPEDPQLRCTLASSTRALASSFKLLGRWKESRQHFAESAEIMDRVVAENPAVIEFRRILALRTSELGDFLIDREEIDAGLKVLAKARDQIETVRRTNPDDVRNLYASVLILRAVGKARAIQGNTTEALDVLRQAIAVGELIAGEDGLFTYQLACVLALYGDVLGRESSAASQAPNNESLRYSNKAMDVLRKAVERGYREAAFIEQDADFRPLHSRSDFQALIKSLRVKP